MPSSSLPTYQTQQVQQQQPQINHNAALYHRPDDQLPNRGIEPHISYQFEALQAHNALQQSRQQQQQQQQQHAQAQAQAQVQQQLQQEQQQAQQQYLPQTSVNQSMQHPQAPQPSAQSQDETMQVDDDDDESSDGEDDTNGDGSGPKAGSDGYMAPLVQPITALQLPKVRPTLMLGPYETREEAMNIAQEYAISQGYCLVQTGCAKQKTPGGKYTPESLVVRVDLMCDRGGTCKNIGTGKRKRPTHKLGCPCRVKLVCRKREACKWFIDPRCEEHNHDLDPKNMDAIASYRRWRRIQAGGPSTESVRERHARARKPKVMPPVPPPKFHQVGGLGAQPPAAPTSPLHIAALKGQCKIMTILLDKGADINAHDSTGRTPLHCGIEGQRMDVVKLLVERGADVTRLDAKGISPLHMAVEKGMEDAVVYFIEQGADPNK